MRDLKEGMGEKVHWESRREERRMYIELGSRKVVGKGTGAGAGEDWGREEGQGGGGGFGGGGWEDGEDGWGGGVGSCFMEGLGRNGSTSSWILGEGCSRSGS